MDSKKEHDSVALSLIEKFKNTYTILSNVEKQQHFIASIFPDLILIDKTTGKVAAAIEVKRNGNIAGCLQQWKNIKGGIPVAFFLVVPQSDLKNAQDIARVVGINCGFGYYTIDPHTENVVVNLM